KQNSELANIKKISDASAKQALAIKKIIEKKGIDFLSDDLKVLALLRLENPDMSLKELGENLNPKISRSGVNHRIERIFKIANSL
ncbi:MAG: DNA-binding protein WhiA, partial [Ruminococcus sp.]|nr:DNA-binding protein WhiA [Ruminococcus sp.]